MLRSTVLTGKGLLLTPIRLYKMALPSGNGKNKVPLCYTIVEGFSALFVIVKGLYTTS
jgi:hypothetical protein